VLHLGDKSRERRNLDPDRLVRVPFVVHTNGKLVAVKIKWVQQAKIGEGYSTVWTDTSRNFTCDSSELIPVAMATFPRKLNQLVTV
jgi:hypothetical protein